MNNGDLFSEAFRLAVATATREHPLKTAFCPGVPALLPRRWKEWTPDVQGHVARCRYCQKTIAMAWRDQCPSGIVLALHLAGLVPLHDAVRAHLTDDGCRRCLELVESPGLNRAVDLMTRINRAWVSFRDFLSHGAVGRVPLTPVVCFADPSQSGPTLEMTMTGCGGITATLREENQRLIIHLETADLALAGRNVAVELAGQGGVRRVEVLLRPVEQMGCFGFHNFGSFEQAQAEIGEDCLLQFALLAAPAEAGPGGAPKAGDPRSDDQPPRL